MSHHEEGEGVNGKDGQRPMPSVAFLYCLSSSVSVCFCILCVSMVKTILFDMAVS